MTYKTNNTDYGHSAWIAKTLANLSFYKTVPQFKAGDIVHFNGSRFLIREDAHEDQLYRPQAGHLEAAAGPSEIARAVGDWLDGEFRGFNGLERYWNFIGCNSGPKYRTEKFNPQHSQIAA